VGVAVGYGFGGLVQNNRGRARREKCIDSRYFLALLRHRETGLVRL